MKTFTVKLNTYVAHPSHTHTHKRRERYTHAPTTVSEHEGARKGLTFSHTRTAARVHGNPSYTDACTPARALGHGDKICYILCTFKFQPYYSASWTINNIISLNIYA